MVDLNKIDLLDKKNNNIKLSPAQIKKIYDSFVTDNPILINMTIAKNNGMVKYYTGKLCKQGHITCRYTSNRRCVKCDSNNPVLTQYKPIVDTKHIILDRISQLKKTKKPNKIIEFKNYIIIIAKSKSKNPHLIKVDKDDYYGLLQYYSWHITAHGYAQTSSISPTGNCINIKMHQMVLLTRGIDHRDFNKLNNCKSNLRPANAILNNINHQIVGTYRGASLTKAGTYKAYIGFLGKKFSIGTFPKKIMAANAYDIIHSYIHGPDTVLNVNSFENFEEELNQLTQQEVDLIYTKTNNFIKNKLSQLVG